MHTSQCQHDVDVHLLFCFDHYLHIAPPEIVFKLYFLCQFSLMGTTLRAAPSKSYAVSTKYYACIVMPTFLRRSSLMGTTLRVARS